MPALTHRRALGWIAAGWAVCCFSFFQFLLPYHLFFKEQMQLFLLTWEYFLSYQDKPAWLACYAGDFLTQFFYLRGGGAATLSLVLLVEYLLTVSVLRRIGWKRYAAPFALLPTGVDAFLHCGLYYGLAASTSVILTLFAFLLFTQIKPPTWTLLGGLLVLPCLHAMAGASFILFPVLVAIYAWRRGGSGLRRYVPVLLIPVALLYPTVARPCYLLTIGQAYRYPFPSSLNVRGVDAVRETILSLAVEAGRGNWGEVGRRAAASGVSNAIVAYYANIASSQQGRLAEDLLSRYQPFAGGLFLPVSSQSGWLTISFSHEVWYHLGDVQMAQHSAMLGMIFSPRHRSAQMLRRLAEIHRLGGDAAVADKYDRILDATLFRRRMERREAPSCEPSVVRKDTLRTASDYVASLELLADAHPGGPAVDYLLCYHLLNKDVAAFASAYDHYRKGRPGDRLPHIYAEALLIRLAAGQASVEELQSYDIPRETIVAFMDYTRLYEQSGGSAGRLRERFGQGYWFYYHFATYETGE
ncbi:MAG: DUF6057 family protein [Tannerellaceae bacterium]|jgi:hypothetical protein|nr:DUF6057 family protein [Tannerellaceae bacterium]